jgi:hypothetical protein
VIYKKSAIKMASHSEKNFKAGTQWSNACRIREENMGAKTGEMVHDIGLG